MIDFEYYRDFLSNSINEAYEHVGSPHNDVKSALLCVLEAMGELKILLDDMATVAKNDCFDGDSKNISNVDTSMSVRNLEG